MGHSEDFFKNATLVRQALDMGLVVFAWGEEANHKDNIKKLKVMGVDGVIYDRLEFLRLRTDKLYSECQ